LDLICFSLNKINIIFSWGQEAQKGGKGKGKGAEKGEGGERREGRGERRGEKGEGRVLEEKEEVFFSPDIFFISAITCT
jgi:hypothetical protein